jgi:hypothetical protein
MNTTRKEFSALFERIPLFLVGLFLIAFPLIFSVQMTEAFLLPKHLLLAVIVTLAMVSLALHMILSGKMRVRTTPFDIPVLLFTFMVILSAYLSVNKFDALIAAVPFLYAALLFYAIVNTVRTEKALMFVISCLIIGAAGAGLLSIFAFFHIYLLPFVYTRSPYFTSVGSLLDQAIYLAIILPIAGYFAMNFLTLVRSNQSAQTQQNTKTSNIVLSIAFLIIAGGFTVTLFYLFTSQAPLVLPLANGFQIAFAAISQDAGRLLKSFLFGSGYGTFLNDFMRFKQPSYNSDSTLWAVTFLRSSSFILELLATTGILGVLAFLNIIYRIVREKTLFLPLVIAVVAAFILPFSSLIVTLFFAVLAIFAVARFQSNAAFYEEVELHLVAFKEKVSRVPVGETSLHGLRKHSVILPGLLILVLLGIIGFTDYYTLRFAVSDMIFQQSLLAASRNNGNQTYKLQTDAINVFPYRDVYHRVFSQTNLQLANALTQQTPKGASPSAQVQQTVLTLIQQSINTGRLATTLSPYNALNWNNLSGVYRSLIGFGQNADQFAVLTSQQAIALDPSNPQQYVSLGGIYYQLGLWDEAIRQFQLAIQLKSDYANAYYNAGHALEAKGNLAQALAVYQAAGSLIINDTQSSKKLAAEIDVLKKKISEQSTQVAGAATKNSLPESSQSPQSEQNLNVNTPPAQLPTMSPQAKIEGPTINPLPSLSPAPSQ